MVSKISQTSRVKAAVTPQDISSAKTGAYIDVSGAQRVLVAVTTASIAATKKVSVNLLQAKDAAGTGSKALGTVTEKVAPTGGAALDLTVDATVETLDKDYSFIAVQLSSDNGSAVQGAAMLILAGNRYNP